MNATQISTEPSLLNLLRLLKSSLKQISLHETNVFSICAYLLQWWIRVTHFENWFWLVSDDITSKYKHDTDDNIVPDVKVI